MDFLRCLIMSQNVPNFNTLYLKLACIVNRDVDLNPNCRPGNSAW